MHWLHSLNEIHTVEHRMLWMCYVGSVSVWCIRYIHIIRISQMDGMYARRRSVYNAFSFTYIGPVCQIQRHRIRRARRFRRQPFWTVFMKINADFSGTFGARGATADNCSTQNLTQSWNGINPAYCSCWPASNLLESHPADVSLQIKTPSNRQFILKEPTRHTHINMRVLRSRDC